MTGVEKKVNLAILGATGNVGRKFLEVLEERNFPVNNIKLLASGNSSGRKLTFKEKEYMVELATKDSFKGINLVLASAGGKVSKDLAWHAVDSGAVYIDNSSFFRMEKDVPIIVVGVNESEIKNHKGIISNPNCTMAQLVVVLKALHDLAGLKRVIVSSYQSVSGAGKAAIDTLTRQTKEYLEKEVYTYEKVNRKFAFNVVPHIDDFSDDGYTKEELKIINETRKVLGLPKLRMTCTAVRVPVFIGHSESVNVELEKHVTRDEIIESLKNFRKGEFDPPLIEVIDEPENEKYPMAIDIAGTDPVYVGRIREDESNPNTFNMWVVADNLRIGAALNTVRIAEVLINKNLLKTLSTNYTAPNN